MSLEVRFYRPETLRIGPVTLEGLRLVRREPLKVSAVSASDAVEKVYDILVNIVERYKGDRDVYVVEVSAKLKTGEIAAATLTRQQVSGSTVMLFPRPARLVRLGVIDSAGRVTWYQVGGEVYVFHGRLELGSDARAIILETEEGARIVTLQEVEDYRAERAEARKQQRKTRRRRRKS